MQHKLKKYIKQISVVVGILVIAVSLPYVLKLVSKPTEYKKVPAAELAVNLSIEPVGQTLPPDANLKIMMNTGTNKVSFVRVSLLFDKSKIGIVDEILTTPLMERVIMKSTPAEANESGTVVLVLGVAPSSSAPSGIIELASFNVSAVSTKDNDTANIYFVVTDTQVIDEGTLTLNKTVSDISLVLNPGQPTQTSTVAPEPTAIATPNPTATTAPIPTATPTPKDIPTIESCTCKAGSVVVNNCGSLYPVCTSKSICKCTLASDN